MSLLVQQYLKDHTFGQLAKEHGVYVSFAKSGYKFSLNYDMIEAKEDNILACQCRGLILATHDGRELSSQAAHSNSKLNYDDVCPGETVVAARAMDRFFNFGQETDKSINWQDPNLKVWSKLDGTLAIIGFDWFSGKWFVATRSSPEADIVMDNGIFTFRTLFEKALQDTLNLSWCDFTAKLDPNYTYCFELTTPLNQIVVNYKNYGITLIAARNKITDTEISINLPMFDWLSRPTSYDFSDVHQVVQWVSDQNPQEHEGVVVMDSLFNRIKIKNQQYVLMSKMRDTLGTSERNCLELILNGKEDDAISFLPQEIINNLSKIKSGLQQVIKDHDIVFHVLLAETNLIESHNKKTFALFTNSIANARNGKVWTAPLFNMFDKKSSNMSDFIQQNRKNGTWSDSFLDKLLDLIKLWV